MEFNKLLTVLLVSISIFVTVNFAQDAQMTIMPESIYKNLGSSIIVECSVSAEPELVTNMEWHGPNGKRIPNDDETITTILGSASNELQLFIKKLRAEDVGEYECTANYAVNQKRSKNITVKYFKKIDFGDTKSVQTPILGSDAKIRCVVSSEPAAQVDWIKDGVPLKPDSRVIQQADGILIKDITERDEGVYKCRARVLAADISDIDEIDIQVEVHSPPVITGKPKDMEGVEKEAVKMQCVATGKPAPRYTWVNRHSENLEGKEGYYVDERTGELTILNLKPDDYGVYRCIAENAAGTAEAEANLKVLTKPKIEQHLNLTKAVGSDVTMECILTGDPLPKAVFKKETLEEAFTDGVNVGGHIEVRQDTDFQGRRVGKLIISDLTREDDGLYTCSGVSKGGVTVSWGHITVEFAPTFETQSKDEFWSWDENIVNVTCLATSIPNATVEWFLREDPIRPEDRNLKVLATGPNGVLQVNPVDGSYFDTYTCKATNTIGSLSHKVSLKLVREPGGPSVTKEKTTATTVTWKIGEPTDNGGLSILGYTVQYRIVDTSWDQAQERFWTKGSSYVVDGLLPQMTYIFRFAAKNEVGIGDWSGDKSVEMPRRAAPEAPLIYGVNDNEAKVIPYSDHYDLQWKVPAHNGEQILKYRIVYYQVEKVSNNWKAKDAYRGEIDVPAPGSTTKRIPNLSSDSFYKIELRAYNKIGFSRPAQAVIKTAYSDEPEQSQLGAGPTGGVLAAIIIIILLLIIAVVADVALYCTKNIGVTATVMKKVALAQTEKDKEAMIEDGKQISAAPVNESQAVTEVKECNETTPMMEGSEDKQAIKKEESKNGFDSAQEPGTVNPAMTKDSTV